MISIPAAVEAAIKKRPFLEGALVEGLINLSALARSLKSEIEQQVGKEVNDSAVIMALNRLVPRLGSISPTHIGSVVDNLGDITVRSNLADYTFANSASLHHKQAELLGRVNQMKNIFCTFTQGIYETTLVVSDSLSPLVEELFEEEQLTCKNNHLSLITVKLPSDNTSCPGVYYYLFKELAWENINIVEVISTTNEFTIVVNDSDIQQAFAVLMSAKRA
ncbi:MAG: aspartate kinase [Tidjanibacter sp.]|nr:aspartate kinase [Tidjanibacter sp.]